MQPLASEPQRLGRSASIRAVVDSCVFAKRRWIGPIALAAQAGYLVPLWSPCIIAETSRLLTWLWMQRHPGPLDTAARRAYSEYGHRWFDALSPVFSVVEDQPPPEPMWADPRDTHDAPIWTAAVRGRALYVVTENLKDGPPVDVDGLRTHAGITYIHPDDFVPLVDLWAELVAARQVPIRDRLPLILAQQAAAGAQLPEHVEAYLRLMDAQVTAD